MNYTSIAPNAKPVRTILLKGEPGMGKTYKAAQFPAPVFFNFDNNLAGLRRLPQSVLSGIRIVDPYSDDKGKAVEPAQIWTNFVRQLGEVCADDSVRTIVIDSLTTLTSNLMNFIVGSNLPTAQIQLKHWGDFKRYLDWFGGEFLCDPKLDKNIIVIAHEQIEKDELTQSIRYTLNIGGQMRNGFDLYFSDCWRLYVKQPVSGPLEYRVRTQPAANHTAKNTLIDVPNDFVWDTEAKKILAQFS